jgi:hypothetical protein
MEIMLTAAEEVEDGGLQGWREGAGAGEDRVAVEAGQSGIIRHTDCSGC